MAPGGVLDVEDADQRLLRLQSALEKLNNSSDATSKTAAVSTFNFLGQDELMKPCHVDPPTEPYLSATLVLSRVQAFLPKLEASNALLASQDFSAINIENVGTFEGSYIEMNLGLGLFDVRGSTASNSSVFNENPVIPLPASPSTSTPTSSDEDYDYDSDSSEDAEIITSFEPVRPVRPLPRRALAPSTQSAKPSVLPEPEAMDVASVVTTDT
ncbi:hypothetical protein H0H93_003754 [Arthromyces matolae]|nr:hypothetical protein H0H93_003754 [Arthromyces matolae]